MNIDGAEIFVEQLPGTGKLNFVLIHNAGSDHRFFTHQIEMLRKFGDVVQLDLPGSGKSHPMKGNSFYCDSIFSIGIYIKENMAVLIDQSHANK